MNLKNEILKILKEEPLSMSDIIDKLHLINEEIKDGTIRQNVRRLKIQNKVIFVQNSFSVKIDGFYCLPNQKKQAYNKMKDNSEILLNKYGNRIKKALISDFYCRIIDFPTLKKIAGIHVKSPNRDKLPELNHFINKISNKYSRFEFKNIDFLIHNDYFYIKDEENRLNKEAYAKINFLIDIFNEEIPYRKKFYDKAQKTNLIGWNLITTPKNNKKLVEYNGIPFDAYGMSYLNIIRDKYDSPRPVLFDVLTYRKYEDFDASGFVNRVESIKNNKGKFFNALGVVFCRSFSLEAQRILKNRGYLIYLIGDILGTTFSSVLQYTSPKELKIEEIKPKDLYKNTINLTSSSINKDFKYFEGTFNGIKGRLFEFITAYTLSTDSNLKVEFHKADIRTLDLYVEDNNKKRWWIECKAYSKSQETDLYNEAKRFLKKMCDIRKHEDNKEEDILYPVKAIFICLHKSKDVENLLINGKTKDPSEENVFRPKKTKFLLWDGDDLIKNVNIDREKKIIRDSINLLLYLEKEK